MKAFLLLLFFPVGLIAFGKIKNPETEKSIPCDEKIPKLVRVMHGRVTVLNFPFKPKDVVPGSQAFDFKQIKNDLIVTSVKPRGPYKRRRLSRRAQMCF